MASHEADAKEGASFSFMGTDTSTLCPSSLPCTAALPLPLAERACMEPAEKVSVLAAKEPLPSLTTSPATPAAALSTSSLPLSVASTARFLTCSAFQPRMVASVSAVGSLASASLAALSTPLAALSAASAVAFSASRAAISVLYLALQPRSHLPQWLSLLRRSSICFCRPSTCALADCTLPCASSTAFSAPLIFWLSSAVRCLILASRSEILPSSSLTCACASAIGFARSPTVLLASAGSCSASHSPRLSAPFTPTSGTASGLLAPGGMPAAASSVTFTTPALKCTASDRPDAAARRSTSHSTPATVADASRSRCGSSPAMRSRSMATPTMATPATERGGTSAVTRKPRVGSIWKEALTSMAEATRRCCTAA
mmetsp:Transcript_8386/g.26232  ORF Transcript_8386/g.26232 Transcript_8386/m.26232 type:complete len:372 (-) Transcript_8386:887-2002(-)